ncbi:endolytic transglycosylase MltG [Catenovulum sp. SM1970]|uniref:endolytic transglycosylase MltG n=1 Tax=Marinifaba aquimaris TaxID=2741323 RepID=UPI0015716280|nr:endolytic transglycosylase MltG [Marinifaba aquimaris]
MIKAILKKLLFLFFSIIALALAGFYLLNTQWQSQLSFQEASYEVKPGWSYYRIVQDLTQQEQLEHAFPYKVFLWLNPQYRKIHAGHFVLPKQQLSFEQFMQALLKAEQVQYKLTFVEGSHLKQWLAQLKQAPFIDKQLTNQDNKKALVKTITGESVYPSLEGLLLPETYLYTKNITDQQVIKQAYLAMRHFLTSISAQIQGQSLSEYEVLILASIIEKETALVSEMPLISSVFHNRLNKGMRLQTDPTVIYGLGDRYKGDITRAHLREKTAYNTYRIKGLPPTPIAMPSKQAILATLNPAQSDYYYFVANGEGGHTFSKTLKEHNSAVKAYLKKQGHTN